MIVHTPKILDYIQFNIPYRYAVFMYIHSIPVRTIETTLLHWCAVYMYIKMRVCLYVCLFVCVPVRLLAILLFFCVSVIMCVHCTYVQAKGRGGWLHFLCVIVLAQVLSKLDPNCWSCMNGQICNSSVRLSEAAFSFS